MICFSIVSEIWTKLEMNYLCHTGEDSGKAIWDWFSHSNYLGTQDPSTFLLFLSRCVVFFFVAPVQTHFWKEERSSGIATCTCVSEARDGLFSHL